MLVVLGFITLLSCLDFVKEEWHEWFAYAFLGLFMVVQVVSLVLSLAESVTEVYKCLRKWKQKKIHVMELAEEEKTEVTESSIVKKYALWEVNESTIHFNKSKEQ